MQIFNNNTSYIAHIEIHVIAIVIKCASQKEQHGAQKDIIQFVGENDNYFSVFFFCHCCSLKGRVYCEIVQDCFLL